MVMYLNFLNRNVNISFNYYNIETNYESNFCSFSPNNIILGKRVDLTGFKGVSPPFCYKKRQKL